MSRTISHQMIYDAPIDRVTAMLADPEFRREVCAYQRYAKYDVTIEPQGDGMEVNIDQLRPTDGIPGFAKKIVGDTTNIVQHEVWSSPTRGDITVTIPGKPGDMRGTAVIVEENGQTVETVELTVKVGIPLISGKLEDFIGSMLLKALKAEGKVGAKYLAR